MSLSLSLSPLMFVELWTLSSCIVHLYVYVPKQMHWLDARRYCRVNYTDLATVTNMEEVNRLRSMARHYNLHWKAWIGLYNDINSWRWSLSDSKFYGPGEAKFRKWVYRPIQPDNYGGKQACALMRKDGFWDDRNCETAKAFICYNQGEDIQPVILCFFRSFSILFFTFFDCYVPGPALICTSFSEKQAKQDFLLSFCLYCAANINTK